MSAFSAQQITRSHAIHLPAAPHEVFPLFSPLGEKRWVHGWNPTMLYPASGATQPDMVFTTQHANEPAKIWAIIAYTPEQSQISYLNVLPTSHMSKVEVACEADGVQRSTVRITYTLTSLTRQGNSYLDGFTQEHYQEYISSWETALTYYLLHGHVPAHTED